MGWQSFLKLAFNPKHLLEQIHDFKVKELKDYQVRQFKEYENKLYMGGLDRVSQAAGQILQWIKSVNHKHGLFLRAKTASNKDEFC